MNTPPQTHNALVSTAELTQLHTRAMAAAHSARQFSAQPYPGPQPAYTRGQGLELHDLRGYQHGDDVRHIAWRASGRGGPPLVKVFQAEQQQRCFLMVDQHAGMTFGTNASLKATTAVRCAATLAFLATAHHAEVAGLVIQNREQPFPYSAAIDHALTLLRAANHLPDQRHWPRIPMAKSLAHIRHLAPKHTTVYLISDFHNWDDQLSDALTALVEQRDVHALQIIDEGEQHLPATGKLRLISPFDGQRYIIDSDDAGLRQRYREHMEQDQAQLRELLQRHGIRHHRLTTDQDTFRAILNIAKHQHSSPNN